MLADKALKALKPREKPYKRADEKGAIPPPRYRVIVRPDRALGWRFKYRRSFGAGSVPRPLAQGDGER